MTKWIFKWGPIIFKYERPCKKDKGDGGDSWNAIAVFLALAGLILQAVAMAL